MIRAALIFFAILLLLKGGGGKVGQAEDDLKPVTLNRSLSSVSTIQKRWRNVGTPVICMGNGPIHLSGAMCFVRGHAGYPRASLCGE